MKNLMLTVEKVEIVLKSLKLIFVCFLSGMHFNVRIKKKISKKILLYTCSNMRWMKIIHFDQSSVQIETFDEYGYLMWQTIDLLLFY